MSKTGRVMAISDAGIRLPLRPARRGAGGRRSASIRCRAGPGRAARKSNRDTEALLVRGDGLWVAFERHNMIWRYDRPLSRAQSAARPAAMRRWRGNGGAEAMVRLADGRFLVFAEGRGRWPAISEAVLFDGDPAVPARRRRALRYRRPPGYRVTDAALLPDGRLLLLNRRFAWLRGLSAQLVVADLRGCAGRDDRGREIATLEAPLTVDNMEALASRGRAAGRSSGSPRTTISFPLQRTLLLKFALGQSSARPGPRDTKCAPGRELGLAGG